MDAGGGGSQFYDREPRGGFWRVIGTACCCLVAMQPF